MKRILILFFLFVAINAKAGDTLTRAQVYNFNVGDTFDYRDYLNVATKDSSQQFVTTINSTTYTRYVITGLFYSLDSSAKYIERIKLFPLPAILDTLTFQNLLGYEVYLDTNNQFTYWSGSISMGSISEYNGRQVDTLFQFCCQPGFETLIFANGLGEVVNQQRSGCGPCGYLEHSINELIYYSQSSETWGNPYYNFPNAVRQLNTSTDKVALFPTLNDGTFNVKSTDARILPVNLVVYDITGQKIEQRSLNNLSTEVSIGPHSAGVYIWKVFSANELIQTGKMVMH